ncbi:MAG: MFS transporter [Candidatus Gastranaerophilales bacterium]|nr:MFS transporter [Candidatus Gastranaerophilales bacterium]
MTLHQKHGLRLALIIIATTLFFIANIQRVAIPGAIFDLLQGDFNADASKITFLGAIFCYIYAFTQLIVGPLVDKFGGFRVMALGGIIFAIGSIIFPHSEHLIGLYFSRALLGFGAATFYLSTIREVKKYAKDKNFSLAVSYILFIGYSGGIFANAPFVACTNQIGWRNSLYLLGFLTLALALAYLILFAIFKPIHIEKKVPFSFAPFKEVLSNKENLYLYSFGACNYGLYYVLQTVIGKKFLEDFGNFDVNNAALILSLMAIISAFAGTITAFISKKLNNKRAIIFKTFGILSFLSTLSITLFLAFDIHSKIIALIFCIPSYIGSISPILILALHTINRYEICSTAVSIQNFSFFTMVGILGMVSGMLMNVFEPIEKNGILVYQNNSYLLVFGLFFVLSLIQVYFGFKIVDKEKC